MLIKGQRRNLISNRREKAKRIFAHCLISPKVVQGFIDQPRDSHVWMKELSRKQLEDLVYPDWDQFEKEPFLHQLVSIALGIAYPQFLHLLDMGLGKSLVFLTLLRYHRAKQGLGRSLILVPRAVNVESWTKQIKIYAPGLTYVKLLGNAEDRARLIEEETDLCIMNYAGLMVYMTEFGEGKKGKQKRVPVASKVNKFVKRFVGGGLILDESHKLLGSQDSLVYRLAARVAKQSAVRYGGTGTLFGRDPLKAWSQFKIVDDGATLGSTMSLFRQAFYAGSVNPFGGIEWKFDFSREKDVHRIIQHRSIRYEDKEVQDLPDVVSDVVPIELTAEQKLYYNKAVEALTQSRGNFQLVDSFFHRTRQITAGFMGMKSEEGEKAEYIFEDNPKLEALLSILESVPLDTKVVIFHYYRFTGQLIEIALAELGVTNYAVLRGGVKKPIENYNRFLNDPACSVLVANTESGGTGIDELQNVSRFVVFYELPPSTSEFWQAWKRVYRTGQKRRVYRYLLEAMGTVDEKVWGFIEEGRDLFKAICEGRSDAQLRKI